MLLIFLLNLRIYSDFVFSESKMIQLLVPRIMWSHNGKPVLHFFKKAFDLPGSRISLLFCKRAHEGPLVTYKRDFKDKKKAGK